MIPPPVPTLAGIATFSAIASALDPLLLALLACPPTTREAWRGLPESRGIYLLESDGQAHYVGRTNRVRRRIYHHTRANAQHNQATFAFLIARREAEARGLSLDSLTRDRLQSHDEFSLLFREAKERVAGMRVRYVEVPDSNTQAVFEVYAAVVLGTPHNTFENH